MDVYSPPDLESSDSLPALIWMHGGGFGGGNRDYKDEVKLAQYAAGHGYIGISISYRLLRKGTVTGFGCDCPAKDKIETFREAAIDFLDATKYVVGHNRDLHIDPNLIIAGGSSAGAEAILSAVYMKDYYIKDPTLYKNVHFAGMLSMAGAMVDVSYINAKNAVPTVLFHGSEDDTVPFSKYAHHRCDPSRPGYLILYGSENISEKLKELNTSYYLNIVRGGRHEISAIPFADLDAIFEFFNATIFRKRTVQTRIVVNK
jgi:predicted esterase